MTQVAVDPVGWDDVDVVRGLRLAALEDAPDAFWATLEQERDQPATWWRQRVVGEMHWLVARLDGAPVGLAAVGPDHREREGVRALLSFWVAPDARGRGVGDALVTAAVDTAREQGARTLALDVGDHNDAASATYARHGFVPSGETGRFLPPREHITEHELTRPV